MEDKRGQCSGRNVLAIGGGCERLPWQQCAPAPFCICPRAPPTQNGFTTSTVALRSSPIHSRRRRSFHSLSSPSCRDPSSTHAVARQPHARPAPTIPPDHIPFHQELPKFLFTLLESLATGPTSRSFTYHSQPASTPCTALHLRTNFTRPLQPTLSPHPDPGPSIDKTTTPLDNSSALALQPPTPGSILTNQFNRSVKTQ